MTEREQRAEPVKVSVIVPVYNGEKNLKQCLDSIIGQTLQEIEIICVDDGSTDSSLQILQEYAARDERFIVLQQKNQYAGVARNRGKSLAKGEYLVFWDCDDFFALNALESMYEKANEYHADVCVCGGCQYFDNLGRRYPFRYLNMKYVPAEVFNRESNEKYIFNFTNAAPWNKMYRREFVEEQQLDFQAVRNGNDVYFVEMCLALAERITIVDEPFVIYRRNQAGGLVNSLDRSVESPIQAWVSVARDLTERGIFPEQSFANKAVSSIVYMLRNIKTYEAFEHAVAYLQDGMLDALHLYMHDDDFYFTEKDRQIVQHFWNDTPREFHAYLAYTSYIQLTESGAKNRQLRHEKTQMKKAFREEKKSLSAANKALKKERAELKKQLKEAQSKVTELENSRAYKIGCMILWLPRKIRGLFKR